MVAFRRYLSRLVVLAIGPFVMMALPRVALAAPQQAGQSLNIAWWVWLVAIALFLLIAFVIFISLDWGDAAQRRHNEDESR